MSSLVCPTAWKGKEEKRVYLTHVTWSLGWGLFEYREKSVHLEVSEGSSSRSGATFSGTDESLESRCSSSRPKPLWTWGDPQEDSSSRNHSPLHVELWKLRGTQSHQDHHWTRGWEAQRARVGDVITAQVQDTATFLVTWGTLRSRRGQGEPECIHSPHTHSAYTWKLTGELRTAGSERTRLKES